MKHAFVFVTTYLLGGLGAVLGSMVGHAVGRGGLLIGAFVGGLACVVLAGFACERFGWISRPARLWTTLGGLFGFLLAYMSALATMGSPLGPILSTPLVGVGAVLGALVGRSPHEKA